MNIIPLFKEEDLFEQKKSGLIHIPENWWRTDYSVDYNFEIIPQKVDFERKMKVKNLPKTPGWNINNGDYRVRETKTNARDFVYYRDFKLKILKYSIFPVLFVTILVIMKISEVLSKI